MITNQLKQYVVTATIKKGNWNTKEVRLYLEASSFSEAQHRAINKLELQMPSFTIEAFRVELDDKAIN